MQSPRMTLTMHAHARNIITREILAVALDTFRLYRVRFALTALGVMIGTASLIVVVTVGLTGKEYILDQIRGIGANMIRVSGTGDAVNTSVHEYLTLDDMRVVQQEVPGVVAASPMVLLLQHVSVGGGKERDVSVLGVNPQYRQIRNLDVTGRFFDDLDNQERAKVADLAEFLARRIFGTPQAAIGRSLRLGGLPFTIIGTFKERVETFGQSELAGGNDILIPYSVSRLLLPANAVWQLFFSMSDASRVEPATRQIQAILQARHRKGFVFRVENLTQLLAVAARVANALTLVLLLVAAITLVVGGMGIMNIMLATVTARTREIGIRKAVGATAAEIRLQFLAEAVLISLIGGVIGIALGVSLPLFLRIFTSFDIPISALSVFIALAVTTLVGVAFGTAPAARAAQMDPIASLHHQ